MNKLVTVGKTLRQTYDITQESIQQNGCFLPFTGYYIKKGSCEYIFLNDDHLYYFLQYKYHTEI